MRRIVHISDIHFGRVDYSLIGPVTEKIHSLKPDLLVVSGDLTQRARSGQFREAREFLDRFPYPKIIVPGNHDVPAYNVFERFLAPFRNYKKYITEDLEPTFIDGELAVIGVNTARSLTFKNGRINEEQIEEVRQRLCKLPEEMTKILVTHHPFEVPQDGKVEDILGRAEKAMRVLARCGADMLLAGHLHRSYTAYTAQRYKISGHSAIIVQAGTAISDRTRHDESNSFNLILVDHPEISVECLTWDRKEKIFTPLSMKKFLHTKDGWTDMLDQG